jgi:RNA polymerase sigma factor (sigma-70 family)
MTTTSARRTGGIDVGAVTEMVSAAYRDHAASIHGIALRSTRDPEIAADITQEAFLRLVTEAQSGRFPDNVGGWLYRTSANLVISRGRRVSVARRFAPRLVRYDGPAEPDAVAIVQEEHRELDRALATLTTTERVALLMAAGGAAGSEIAARLGRSPGATRTLLCRARIHLRAAIVTGEQAATARSTRRLTHPAGAMIAADSGAW